MLYHSETRIDAHGLRYYVNCYHDLGSDSMHVETLMPDHLDVIAVGNHHAMLGLDMMHHVAQWGANDWSVDETAFDLAELRSDLDAHRAVYLDQDVFQGHNVYRIRARNGLVLLLDMHYMPVNVLRGAIGPGLAACHDVALADAWYEKAAGQEGAEAAKLRRPNETRAAGAE